MWDKIKSAIQLIMADKAKRIDGDGWTVYAVGSTVLRIDLKPDEINPDEFMDLIPE